MSIDIYNLFSENTDTLQEEAASLMGASAPASSGICVGIVDDTGIIIQFRFTQLYNSSNYIQIGLCNEMVEYGSTQLNGNYIYWTPSYEDGGYYYLNGRVPFDMISDNLTQHDDDSYTAYGYALCPTADGPRYYPISEGSPITFWTDTPRFKIDERDEDSVTITIKKLEENYILGGKHSLLLALKLPSGFDIVNGQDSLNGVSTFDITAYTSIYRDSSFKFSGVPSDYSGYFYFIKKTNFGRYYLLKSLKIPAYVADDETISCALIRTWVNNYQITTSSDDTLYASEYLLLAADDWNTFCKNINKVRTLYGLGNYDFVLAIKGEPITADIFNGAYNALNEIYEKNSSLEVPYGFSPANKQIKMQDSFFSGLESALENAYDYISLEE